MVFGTFANQVILSSLTVEMVPFYQHLLTGQEVRFSGVKTMGRGFYRVRVNSPQYDATCFVSTRKYGSVKAEIVSSNSVGIAQVILSR
jgi:hypothetical protein